MHRFPIGNSCPDATRFGNQGELETRKTDTHTAPEFRKIGNESVHVAFVFVEKLRV